MVEDYGLPGSFEIHTRENIRQTSILDTSFNSHISFDGKFLTYLTKTSSAPHNKPSASLSPDRFRFAPLTFS